PDRGRRSGDAGPHRHRRASREHPGPDAGAHEPGARLDEVIHGVHAPRHLLERPYLHAVYDEPEFVVRNIWRLYGGWYDGNPATLKPAPDADVAGELAALAGGADRLAGRARQLVEEGDLRLAGHLAETAALAAPDDPEVHRARAEIFE